MNRQWDLWANLCTLLQHLEMILRAGATQNRGAQSATSYKNTAKVSFLTENKTSNLSVRQNKAGSLKLTSVTVSRN